MHTTGHDRHDPCHFLNTDRNGHRMTASGTPSSENIRQFKYDHHLAKPSRARFHGDQINVRIRMVHIANGQTSEMVYRWLARNRDPVNNWIRKGGFSKVRWDMPKNVVEKVVFLILLWHNIQLDMCLGRHKLVPTRALGCPCARMS